MKIYKQGWNPEWTNKLVPIIGILVVLFLLWMAFNPSANVLRATLNQSTLSLGENESTLMEVLVTNMSTTTQTSVVVTVNAPGSTQLSLQPTQQTIPTLGPEETRKLEFLVNPVDAESKPFLPGSYRIDVSAVLNEQTYLTHVFVSVKK